MTAYAQASRVTGVLLLVGSLLCAPVKASPVEAPRAPPPVEAFASLPKLQSVRLSPDGSRLAVLEAMDGERRLALYQLGTKGSFSRQIYHPGPEIEGLGRLYDMTWVSDDRLILRLRQASVRGGLPITETRMVAINPDFTQPRMIPKLRSNRAATKTNRDTERTYLPPQYQDAILHRLPQSPGHILIQLRRYGQLTETASRVGFISRKIPEHSVYKINVRTGTPSRIEFGSWLVRGYIADVKGNIRVRTVLKETQGRIELRAPGQKKWQLAQVFDRVAGASWTPLAFSGNPDVLYISKVSASGRSEIHQYSTRARAIGKRIGHHPLVDMDGLVLDRDGGAIGVDFTRHHPQVAYFEEPWVGLQKNIDAALPSGQNYIKSADDALQRFMIYSTSPTDPGTWRLMHGAKEKSLTFFAEQYPALPKAALQPMEPVSFTARDGLEISGYVTKPAVSMVGTGPWPMVVMPHGGPNVRDTARFQFEVQFLASRGYAVFQPNFRGSGGFGKAFEEAGHGEWGLKMQDDVTDGTRHMIEAGIADPDRICIAGWSYGGYVALMGGIRTPDLFRCIVAGASITDLEKLVKERGRYLFESNNDPRLGNRWRDRDRMRDTSPVNNADKIKVPVLLLHGTLDRVVPIEHSELMATRLQDHGVPYKFIRLEAGDHFRSGEAGRLRYLRELEAFLNANIGS